MEKCRGIVLLFALAAVVVAAALPCPAGEKKEDEKNILTEDEQRGLRQRGTWELTDDEANRLLEAVKESDPKKAREIAGLREKDPDRFRAELRINAREEYEKIRTGRFERYLERRWKERQTEFVDWLTKNVPAVAGELAKLKDKDPDLYARKYDWAHKRYRRAFEESRDHPEMTKVLLEDLKLQDKRDYLVGKIKGTKSERARRKLIAQLERVLSDRYELIVIRKQMYYERLLRRLEGLQSWIKKSRAEIEEAKKRQIKDENIRQRIKTLLEEKKTPILH